jgi:pyrroloquinoline quinone biosynthesis protein B
MPGSRVFGLRILVLGSAAGGGFPQWNCACANCRRARSGDPAATPRTQSSIAVTADNERWVLFNASPDLPGQVRAQAELQPFPSHLANGAARHSPIAAVVLSNGDIDHVAGLLSLRESQKFTLYASQRVLGVLQSNTVFNALNADLVPRRELPLNQAVNLQDAGGMPLGLTVRAFAVPGKVALYLEDESAGPDFGTRPGDTVGLEVSDGRGSRFIYLPGCAAVPADLAGRLRGAELVFFDGTLWRDDEMIAAGVGAKTGKRMGHISVSGPEGSLAAFTDLDIRRKIFIHINNTNPILLSDSAERKVVEAAGWEVATDGMEAQL